jgi:hypothetical protein
MPGPPPSPQPCATVDYGGGRRRKGGAPRSWSLSRHRAVSDRGRRRLLQRHRRVVSGEPRCRQHGVRADAVCAENSASTFDGVPGISVCDVDVVGRAGTRRHSLTDRGSSKRHRQGGPLLPAALSHKRGIGAMADYRYHPAPPATRWCRSPSRRDWEATIPRHAITANVQFLPGQYR